MGSTTNEPVNIDINVLKCVSWTLNPHLQATRLRSDTQRTAATLSRSEREVSDLRRALDESGESGGACRAKLVEAQAAVEAGNAALKSLQVDLKMENLFMPHPVFHQSVNTWSGCLDQRCMVKLQHSESCPIIGLLPDAW